MSAVSSVSTAGGVPPVGPVPAIGSFQLPAAVASHWQASASPSSGTSSDPDIVDYINRIVDDSKYSTGPGSVPPLYVPPTGRAAGADTEDPDSQAGDTQFTRRSVADKATAVLERLKVSYDGSDEDTKRSTAYSKFLARCGALLVASLTGIAVGDQIAQDKRRKSGIRNRYHTSGSEGNDGVLEVCNNPFCCHEHTPDPSPAEVLKFLGSAVSDPDLRKNLAETMVSSLVDGTCVLVRTTAGAASCLRTKCLPTFAREPSDDVDQADLVGPSLRGPNSATIEGKAPAPEADGSVRERVDPESTQGATEACENGSRGQTAAHRAKSTEDCQLNATKRGKTMLYQRSSTMSRLSQFGQACRRNPGTTAAVTAATTALTAGGVALACGARMPKLW